jgi:hypothetical protein
MNVKEAGLIADQILKSPDDVLNVYDKRVETAAFAVSDTNHDFGVDRRELIEALVAGRVKEQDGKIIPATVFRGSTGTAAEAVGGQRGMAPANWMQGGILPGGDPANPPKPFDIVGAGSRVGAGQMGGTLSDAQIGALKGQSFATVAGQVKTPEDVARFLNQNITYDTPRLADSKGNLGSWSSAELLKSGTGVCRDQHALARDLLQAAGYEAVLLGYSGSDQSHAITTYKDPKTGLWGMLEYGTLYPPDQLKAHSAEEALLMVRPTTLAISHFSSDGPNQRSHVDGITYTPTSRVFEQFTAGPSPLAGTGVTVSNKEMAATVSSNDRTWQAGMKIVTDPKLPYLQGAVMVGAWHTFANAGVRVGVGGGYVPNNTSLGVGNNVPNKHGEAFGFVSAEEFHPEMLHFANIGGSGITVDVGSHTSLQAVVGSGNERKKNKDETFTTSKRIDIEGAGAGLSSLRWNPTISAKRDFSVWGDTPDTQLRAGYGLGVDAGLLGAHYATGGRDLPINQYVTAGIETHPTPWLGLSADGYAPITNHTNDFAASPMVRLAVTTPYATLATTQGKDSASYQASSGIALGKVQLSAFAGINQDKITQQTDKRVGVQATVLSW